MAHPRIATGMYAPPNLPMSDIRMLTAMARLDHLDSLFVYDHFQDFYPTALWDRDFTWAARRVRSPHALFEYQTLLGSLAARAGRMQLGVGVTKPIGRHPVLIAQAALTLAHLTKRAPILGIGTGERMNIEPYGLPGTHAVDRIEEALQIIRRCFTSQGPIDFAGKHFRLERAVMDLEPPPGRTPEIWIAAHGLRMLQLTGRYGDGWLPIIGSVTSPGGLPIEARPDPCRSQRRRARSRGHHPRTVRLHRGRSHRAEGARPAEQPFLALLRSADSRRPLARGGGGTSLRCAVRRVCRYRSGTVRPGHSRGRDRGGAT